MIAAERGLRMGLVTAGFFLGSIPWVKENLDKIIWAMIILPGLLAMFGAWKSRHAAKSAC